MKTIITNIANKLSLSVTMNNKTFAVGESVSVLDDADSPPVWRAAVIESKLDEDEEKNDPFAFGPSPETFYLLILLFLMIQSTAPVIPAG